jgi:hypothetical protein
MLTIEKVDPKNRQQVDRFIRVHTNLYKACPQWVPPISSDIRTMMDVKKHPFYDHSVADFFIAVRDGEDVGRISAMENCPFNAYHGTKDAEFYLFDSIDDQEIANALFARAFEWAKKRGLNKVVGPKGFSPFDGYGIQIEGFQHRQMMNMMNYNYDYYPRLVETLGFEKEVDFVSCYINRETFHLPDKIRLIAEKVQERGNLVVQNYKTKRDLVKVAEKIRIAYNKTFIKNWEYYPFTPREIKYAIDNVLMIADPQLIKLITHGEDIVGFLFGFPDASAAMQRAKGSLNPLSLADLLIDMKRTKWVSLNGAGVLPEFQGRGGNALMYTEMEKTLQNYHFVHAELTQVAETTKQMRADLINVGGQPYKNHRVYRKSI